VWFYYYIDHFHFSNRVFTEGTCKLLNLVISDLVDEDFVIHGRKQAVSALMFGTSALVSKPGQTIAPLLGMWLLSVQTGKETLDQVDKM
jgi:Na+/melibiose symporter-like transporter